MFPTRTLLKLLAVLEEDLKVNQFVAGQFHPWPALRFFLSTKFQDNNQSSPRAPRVVAVEAEIERRFDSLLADRPVNPDLGPQVLAAMTPHARATQGAGVLLISRPEDHSLRTSAGHYAPVMDPWAEIVSARWPTLKVELITPLFNQIQPRQVPALGAVRVRAPDTGDDLAMRKNVLHEGRQLAVLVAKWMELKVGINVPDLPDVFEAELAALWLDKQIYRDLLQSVRPALVITSCCYFPPTVGAVWAARELGIPVADAQHGGNGAYHIGYTQWRNVPPGGYSLLPDYYFVWDNLSANNILRWFPPGTTAHQPLITGRFGLECARRATLGESQRSPIELLTAGGDKVILVTLQSLPSTGLTPLLLEAMRKAPSTWTWLVRGHPISQAWGNKDFMPDALEATMRAAGIVRAEAQLSTSLPLASILPYVNYHVTGFSGTVQECAAYGIRTTFTHPTVWSFFGNYIDIGVADFAHTADDLIRSIAADQPFPDVSSVLSVPRDEATAMNVLTQILEAT